MRRLMAVTFLVAALMATFTFIACKDCVKAAQVADAACAQAGEQSSTCQLARAFFAEQCPVVVVDPPPVTPKTCETLVCPPANEPEKTACADTEGGGVCYAPSNPAVCPVCSDGFECKDPAIGCVAKPVEPPPVEPPTNEAPLIRDEDLAPVMCGAEPCEANPSKVWADVRAAIDRWRNAHPEAWTTRGDLDCLSTGPDGIDAAFLAISNELLRVGITAGQSINGDLKRSDCTFVNRKDTDLYEEGHLFDYSRACVATGPNAMKKLYRRVGAAPPPIEPPPVTPPVVGVCPAAPCPDRVWTTETLPAGWGVERVGQPRWKFNAKVHTMGNADSTPVTVRNEPFCRSVGLSPKADGTLRDGCPMRADGHVERRAVEDWLLQGGPARDSRIGSGQDCTPRNTDNPYAFLAGTGNCRICDTPKTTCSEWF